MLSCRITNVGAILQKQRDHLSSVNALRGGNKMEGVSTMAIASAHIPVGLVKTM